LLVTDDTAEHQVADQNNQRGYGYSSTQRDKELITALSPLLITPWQ
jgi:hypothetical protein